MTTHFTKKVDSDVFQLQVHTLRMDVALSAQKWIMPGVLPADMLTLLAGKGGIGKTTAAIQLAVLGAAGLDTEGNDIEPFSSALILREDPDSETHRRLAAALDSLPKDRRDRALNNVLVIGGMECTSGALVYSEEEDDMVEISRVDPFEVSSADLVRAMICENRNAPKAGRAPLRLVVLDPVKDLMPSGADANSELAVRAAIRSVATLNSSGMAILGITHVIKSTWQEGITNLAEMIKGSGAWVDRARHVLIAGGSRETKQGALFIAKSNVGTDSGRFLRYSLESADLGDGLSAGRVAFGAWEQTDDLMQAFKDAEGLGKKEAKKERSAGKASVHCIELAAYIRDKGLEAVNLGVAAEKLGIRQDKTEMAALRRMVEEGNGGSLRVRQGKGRGKPIEFYLDPDAEKERQENDQKRAELMAKSASWKPAG